MPRSRLLEIIAEVKYLSSHVFLALRETKNGHVSSQKNIANYLYHKKTKKQKHERKSKKSNQKQINNHEGMGKKKWEIEK